MFLAKNKNLIRFRNRINECRQSIGEAVAAHPSYAENADYEEWATKPPIDEINGVTVAVERSENRRVLFLCIRQLAT